MSLEFDPKAETASALRSRAARFRALSKVAYLPFAALMLLRLAEQLEGEAARLAGNPAVAESGRTPLGAPV